MPDAATTTARPETPEQVKIAAEAFRRDYVAVREQIGRAVVGHEEVVEGVLIALFCGGHVLLEGVPGLGKTLLIRSLASALDLSFSRIQFTPDLMPADITGTTVVMEGEAGPGGRVSRQFVFQRGPVFAQMVLADEINRATPKTQSAMLEAMQERTVTVGGTTHPLGKPFFVMATQNPIEQEGTYPLPEAQLDRFFFKLVVGYSSREDMARILDKTTTGTEERIERTMDAARLLSHQALVRRVAIAPHVQDYAVRCVLATHPRGPESSGGGGVGGAGGVRASEFATPMVNSYVRVGASPRAAQALVLAGKCKALLSGRAAVAIEDIRSVARPALRHRLIMNFESQAEGVTGDAVVDNIIATLPA
ncbi:MAG: AAA family ATPase [Phycisphaerales bacterium]